MVRSCVARQEPYIPGALSILQGTVPGQVRGLGHMVPTYFRRELRDRALQRPLRLRTFLARYDLPSSWPGLSHGCLARSMLEEAHGIDSTRFHLVANHLDTKKDQHRAASEYRFSWASEAYSVVDARSACGSVQCRLGWPCREDQGSSDRDAVCAGLRRTETARDRNEPAGPRGRTLPSRRQHHIAIGALDRQCFASCGGLFLPPFGPHS